VLRNFIDPFFLAFDGPIPSSTVGRRGASNVPAQALTLMNSPLVSQEARRWAESAIAKEKAPAARLDAMYMTAFARKPSSVERRAVIAFAKAQAKEYGATGDGWRVHVDTWADIAHVLYNNKEFIFVR